MSKHVFIIKECSVVLKLLAIGQGIQICGQKIEGGGSQFNPLLRLLGLMLDWKEHLLFNFNTVALT